MDPDRIKGAAKDFAGKIEEAVGTTVNDEPTRASGVGRQIEGKTQNLYGQAKDNLRDARSQAERALRDGGDLAEQAVGEGARVARHAADDLRRAIADRPGLSLLVAGVVGFLTGVVVRRN